jgi:PilZ domain
MADSPAASDRRLTLRRELETPVWLEALPRQPDCPSLVRATTRDISNRGAFIWVPPVFSLGQQLRMEMEVAPGPGHSVELKIDCDAEVVRVEPSVAPGNRSGIAVRILRFDAPVPISTFPA